MLLIQHKKSRLDQDSNSVHQLYALASFRLCQHVELETWVKILVQMRIFLSN